MLSIELISYLLSKITYRDWQFLVGNMDHGFYLQPIFMVSGEVQKGRKWYISRYTANNEVIQTAFKAILTAIEHEVREDFTFSGRAIFAPHYALDALMSLADEKNLEKRKT